jgi:hypothetical protein
VATLLYIAAIAVLELLAQRLQRRRAYMLPGA